MLANLGLGTANPMFSEGVLCCDSANARVSSANDTARSCTGGGLIGGTALNSNTRAIGGTALTWNPLAPGLACTGGGALNDRCAPSCVLGEESLLEMSKCGALGGGALFGSAAVGSGGGAFFGSGALRRRTLQVGADGSKPGGGPTRGCHAMSFSRNCCAS